MSSTYLVGELEQALAVSQRRVEQQQAAQVPGLPGAALGQREVGLDQSLQTGGRQQAGKADREW